MTRKDYVLIARAIKAGFPAGDVSGRKAVLVAEFVKELRQTNPAFNAERFITACGLDVDEATIY